jgi:D-beta-D-heptose 7-phosphate kinase/D-beta-D-heptose 1-phosphate adenosyltransferase
VVSFADDTPLGLLQGLQPDLLVKGGDYESKEDIVGWDIVQGYGGEVRLLDRVDSLSTTAIVDRIQGQAGD